MPVALRKLLPMLFPFIYPMYVDGDSGGGSKTLDENDPEVKALLDKYTAGLKHNRDLILDEKKKLQDKMQVWESLGYDPDTLKEMLDRISKDETAKLLAEGKVDEVLAKRTEFMQRDFETKIKALSEKLTEYEKTVEEKDSALATLIIDGQIKEAAIQLKLEPSAIEDAIIRGRSVFALEGGVPVARDASGQLKMGNNGKEKLTPREWLASMREVAPHWWGPSIGGGAAGSGRGGRATVDLSKMSPVEKLRWARKQGNQ